MRRYRTMYPPASSVSKYSLRVIGQSTQAKKLVFGQPALPGHAADEPGAHLASSMGRPGKDLTGLAIDGEPVEHMVAVSAIKSLLPKCTVDLALAPDGHPDID